MHRRGGDFWKARENEKAREWQVSTDASMKLKSIVWLPNRMQTDILTRFVW